MQRRRGRGRRRRESLEDVEVVGAGAGPEEQGPGPGSEGVCAQALDDGDLAELSEVDLVGGWLVFVREASEGGRFVSERVGGVWGRLTAKTQGAPRRQIEALKEKKLACFCCFF